MVELKRIIYDVSSEYVLPSDKAMQLLQIILRLIEHSFEDEDER